MKLPANHHSDTQDGVALVVSLVLLVAMSLIAVSTLSGSRLNERVAANAQQKAIAFEVAESAVEAGFGDWKEGVELIQAGVEQEPPAERMTAFDTGLSVDYDQTRYSRASATTTSVDIDGSVSIQYCGETTLTIGTDINANLNEPAMIGLLRDWLLDPLGLLPDCTAASLDPSLDQAS